MKALYFGIVAIALLAACTPEEPSSAKKTEPINDTRFTIACKLVDKTWDTTWTDMPKNTNFFISGFDGVYYLASDVDRDGYADYNIRGAVIDFEIVSSRLIVDTITRKVELITFDTLQ